MAATQGHSQQPKLDCYVVIHVATTCDEHGVYVTKDSAEVIEIGWILLDAKTLDEVRREHPSYHCCPERARKLKLTLLFPAAPRKCPCKASEYPDHASLQ